MISTSGHFLKMLKINPLKIESLFKILTDRNRMRKRNHLLNILNKLGIHMSKNRKNDSAYLNNISTELKLLT